MNYACRNKYPPPPKQFTDNQFLPPFLAFPPSEEISLYGLHQGHGVHLDQPALPGLEAGAVWVAMQGALQVVWWVFKNFRVEPAERTPGGPGVALGSGPPLESLRRPGRRQVRGRALCRPAASGAPAAYWRNCCRGLSRTCRGAGPQQLGSGGGPGHVQAALAPALPAPGEGVVGVRQFLDLVQHALMPEVNREEFGELGQEGLGQLEVLAGKHGGNLGGHKGRLQHPRQQLGLGADHHPEHGLQGGVTDPWAALEVGEHVLPGEQGQPLGVVLTAVGEPEEGEAGGVHRLLVVVVEAGGGWAGRPRRGRTPPPAAHGRSWPSLSAHSAALR